MPAGHTTTVMPEANRDSELVVKPPDAKETFFSLHAMGTEVYELDQAAHLKIPE